MVVISFLFLIITNETDALSCSTDRIKEDQWETYSGGSCSGAILSTYYFCGNIQFVCRDDPSEPGRGQTHVDSGTNCGWTCPDDGNYCYDADTTEYRDYSCVNCATKSASPTHNCDSGNGCTYSSSSQTDCVNSAVYDFPSDTCTLNSYGCSAGACTVTGSLDFDCDDYDNLTVYSTLLTESEVSASTCVLGCSGSSCCDVQTRTCNSTYEGQYFVNTITNADETSSLSSMICLNVPEYGYMWTNYTNIGLRMYDGTETIKIAIEATLTSPLRISKNGVVYGIALVNINDGNATNMRINTTSGVKAIRRLP